MYKKIGKKEKQLFEYDKANPGLAQMDWSEARNFRESANMLAEQIIAILLFDTRDMRLQHLAAKCYKECVSLYNEVFHLVGTGAQDLDGGRPCGKTDIQ